MLWQCTSSVTTLAPSVDVHVPIISTDGKGFQKLMSAQMQAAMHAYSTYRFSEEVTRLAAAAAPMRPFTNRMHV